MKKKTKLFGLVAVVIVALVVAMPLANWQSALAAELAATDLASAELTAADATDGQAAEPIQIATYEQLRDFIEKENAGEIPANTDVCLTADIVVPASMDAVLPSWSYSNWTPLAKDADHAYNGTFDGAGHTISGIVVYRTYPDPYEPGTNVEDYMAFISFLGANGVVKNLNLEALIRDVNDVSGLVSQNEGVIEGCTFKGNLRSDIYPHDSIDDADGEIGGIAALNLGTIKNCKTLPGTMIYRGGVNAGGIAGRQANGATVSDCENDASITIRATSYETLGVYTGGGGGIVGSLDFNDTAAADPRPSITNCVNRGVIDGEQNMGGICGLSSAGVISGCTNSGTIEGATRGRVGGICGLVYSVENYSAEIKDCSNSGSINLNTGNRGSNIGGIVGSGTDFLPDEESQLPSPFRFTNCKNTGSVIGGYSVGGIIGGLGSCYYEDDGGENVYVHGLMNLGSVSGIDAVGGIAGACPGVMSDTINYGRVSAVQGNVDEYYYCTIGGIAGDCGMTGDMSTSYNLGDISFDAVTEYPVFAGGVTGNCSFILPGCYYSMENSGAVTRLNGTMPDYMGGALSLSQMAGPTAKDYMTGLFDGETSFYSKTVWHTCDNVEQGDTLLAMTPQFEGLSADAAEITAAGVDLSIPATVIFLDKAVVTPKKTAYAYTGKPIVPKITVTLEGEQLTEGADYVVYACAFNDECGKATLYVLGKGKYAGQASCSFTIKPAKASIQSTKVGKNSVTMKMKKPAADYGGKSFQVQYRMNGKSTWKSVTSKKQSVKISKLKKGKAYQIRVRAVKTVDGNKLYGAWSKTVKTKKVR